ncbi:hypothetical protein [Metabacillus fastidiosus]|uniref:hypothetical protein n=1 Tax=Metabacillus fastidiosus TaxID=1458 RepID=UPI003D298642
MITFNIPNTHQQIMYNRWVLLLKQKPNFTELEKPLIFPLSLTPFFFILTPGDFFP